MAGKRDVSSTSPGGSAPSRKAQRAANRKRATIEADIASADKLVAKRRAQLDSALAERSALTAKLARLELPDEQAGPMAYCLKERQHVRIGGAHAVVLANGRPAIAGTCPSCGSKLVRMGAG